MTLDAPTERFAAIPAEKARPHLTRRIGRWLGVLLLLAVVAAAVAVAVVPALTGATPLTVLSGSMEPTLPVGSTVVIRPEPVATIGVGDIITFTDRDLKNSATQVVTHRVISVEPGPAGPAFRTRGDANDAPDPGLVQAADVHGVEWYDVPYVGLVKDRLFSWTGLLFAVGAMLLLVAGHLLLPRTASGSPSR